MNGKYLIPISLVFGIINTFFIMIYIRNINIALICLLSAFALPTVLTLLWCALYDLREIIRRLTKNIHLNSV